MQGLIAIGGADDAGIAHMQHRRRPNQPFQATAKSGPRLNGIAFGVIAELGEDEP